MINNIIKASLRLKKIIKITPLEYNKDLSLKYNNKIYLKREDTTPIKSYKIRGSYNKILSFIFDTILNAKKNRSRFKNKIRSQKSNFLG